MLARRQQLALGTTYECLGAHARELLERGAQLPSGVDAAAFAPQPLPVEKVSPGELQADSGVRAVEALSIVQSQPGIATPELAAKMGIKQNYLYRVLPGLEQEAKVEKKGRAWYPKG